MGGGPLQNFHERFVGKSCKRINALRGKKEGVLDEAGRGRARTPQLRESWMFAQKKIGTVCLTGGKWGKAGLARGRTSVFSAAVKKHVMPAVAAILKGVRGW